VKPEKLEQLLHENECTYLDFKQTQYPFENDAVKSELLKDIIALANAETGREGFILIGAEEIRGGRAKIHGVTSHLNDHDLQQFVNSKIQRPLRFSYEVVPCDGVSLGVISVPVQDGYFFLKNDFGKLCHNIVYYRLGSSTAEKSPDDLMRRGKEIAAKDDEPQLQLEFALIKHPTAIGGSQLTKEVGTSLSVRTRYTNPVSGVELAKLCPDPKKLGFVREADYWMGFAKFLRSALLFAPVGLALKNIGGTTALDIRIVLTPTSKSKLLILGDEDYPARPLHSSKLHSGGLFASHTKFRQEDVTVTQESDEFKITWNIPKALPHFMVHSKGMFYVCAFDSGPIEFNCMMFAENLRHPLQTTLTLFVERESRDLDLGEVQKYSEALTLDDNDTGRGRVA